MSTSFNPTQFATLTNAILPITPEFEPILARFEAILLAGDTPTVTVVGKYNHGKSRLLNELIGQDVFSVADKRETTTLSDHIHNQIRWLDAPGLDADVNYADDGFAHQAIWQQADIRLFVHAMREGEFDAYEMALLEKLTADEQQTHRQNLIIFTQIDQVADTDTLNQISERLQQQFAMEKPYFVSAQRHRLGVEKDKPVLIERSGMPELQASLTKHLAHVPAVRDFEKSHICYTIHQRLTTLHEQTEQNITDLTQFLTQQRQDFEQGLTAVLEKIQDDLRPIMVVEGEDASLEQDSFATKYKLTAGKKDRNRIQVAYSRACIDLNSHLIRYGVVGLPDSQKTNVASLDTVIVAVLGISVKLRRELNIMFFQASGRQRLMREFCHYFELSNERVANKALLKNHQETLVQIQSALTATAELEQY